MRTGPGRVLASVALAAVLVGRSQAQQPGGLTGAAQIGLVYDAILDARFDDASTLRRATCRTTRITATRADSDRPHPVVCELLGVVQRWWEIQLDPASTANDAAFERESNGVIAAAEAWTREQPQRAEAWFYLGGAYGARSQWRVLRGQVLSAARDGKRIKESLEHALRLDPTIKDAYFGIGLYHYYADVAPAAARLLRFLLLLPGGDRAAGLREMREAREGGQLLRSEADYQLHLLYLWYEKDPLRARQLVTGLRDRYPHNPHFYQVIAEINDTYLHDDTASLRAWDAMLAAALEGRLAEADLAEARARLGAAGVLERLHESDRALEHAERVLTSGTTRPYGAQALASLAQGEALDRLGSRSLALDSYRRAASLVRNGDPLGIAARARRGMRNAPDERTASAYRLSLEGWRALERGSLDDAARLLEQARALRPDDLVTTFRRARLLVAQRNPRAALPLFEQAATARPGTLPPAIQGYALIDAATLLEESGAPARAIEYFTRVTALFGADERSKDAARRALARRSPIPRARASDDLTRRARMGVVSTNSF